MQIDFTGIQAASYLRAGASLSASYLEITGTLAPAKSQDSLDLSGVAKELWQRAKDLDIFKIIYPNGDVGKQYKSLDEVEADFTDDFKRFASLFASLSGALGLDSSAPLTMGLNGVGGVDVAGDGGAAEKVREAFAKSETMVSRFAVMAARAALVDARSSVSGFASAYSQDPVAAIKDNIDSLKELLLEFRVVAGGGGTVYGFVRESGVDIQYSALAACAAGEATAAEGSAGEDEAGALAAAI